MEFSEWQEQFVTALESAGLAGGQAWRYAEGGDFEEDARKLWKKGYTLDLAVMHELLGPDCPQFRQRLKAAGR